MNLYSAEVKMSARQKRKKIPEYIQLFCYNISSSVLTLEEDEPSDFE